jgi:hypothetical protein
VRNLQFTTYDGCGEIEIEIEREREREKREGREGGVSRKRTDKDVVESQTYIANRNR